MAGAVYLHPLTLVSGPQAVDGEAVRLGGSMAYAREFALVVRDGGAVDIPHARHPR
jgi:dihydropteroate synthase